MTEENLNDEKYHYYYNVQIKNSSKNSANSPSLRNPTLNFLDNNTDSPLESFAEETKKNITNYKESLMKTIIIAMLFLTIIVTERIASNPLISGEIALLMKFQKSQFLGIDPYDNINYFYALLGNLGEFRIFFLIQTHVFITIYVGIDAFIALKTAFLQFLGCYIISIFSMFYATPRPYWMNSKIRSYFCDQTFSSPGEFQFSFLFLVFYLYKSLKELEEEVVLIGTERESMDSFALIPNDSGKRNRILKAGLIVCILIFFLVFFFRYSQGLSFLHTYVVGFVYFASLLALVIFGDNFLQNMIKQTTIMKNYAKQKIFYWLAFLFVAEAFAIFMQTSFDMNEIKLEWIENYVFFLKKRPKVILFFHIYLDPLPTKKRYRFN